MTAPVSVAVVSWNTRALLGQCLRSLAPDARAGLASVWVVDNASSDGSADMVREEFPWVSLLASSRNLGFGPAVNEVARRTNGPWLAAANADVELLPGALEALVEAGERDPRVGAVAPRLLTTQGATQHSVHPFPTLPLTTLHSLGLYRLAPGLADRLCLEGWWDPSRARAVDWAHGAVVLFRRAAFDAVGRFDPEQWLYAEDLDIAWRLSRAGWKVRYEPAATVGHAVSAATRQAFGDACARRQWAASYAWMLRRRGLARTWATAALNLLGALLRVIVLAPGAALGAGRSRSARNAARAHLALHRLGLRSRDRILRGAPAVDTRAPQAPPPWRSSAGT